MLNLEEIKAREQAATKGPWRISGDIKHLVCAKENQKEYDGPPIVANCGVLYHSYTKQHIKKMQENANFIAHARTDIPALIAEVERLTAETQQNADYADIYKDICDKYGQNFRILLDKAKALQEENAKLDKCRHNCKLECLLDEYNKVVAERDTLKKALELACYIQTFCPYTSNGGQRKCNEESGLKCKTCAPNYFIQQAQEGQK